MKQRKEYLHRQIKANKKMRAGIRTDQKTPRLNYTIGKVHRRVKKRNPKTYRAKLITMAIQLLIRLRKRKEK